MVNGKRKGGEFEREKAREVSLWITNGERDDTVWRSASSGAVATIRSKKTVSKGKYKSQAGDLCSIDPISAPFFNTVSIELKHYADLQFENILFLNCKSKAIDFWEVHKELCSRVGTVPFLIMKQNRKPTVLWIPSFFKFVIETYAIPYVEISKLECISVQWEDFIETISYIDFSNEVDLNKK